MEKLRAGEFFQSNQKLAEKAGYPQLFYTRDLELCSNKMCMKLIKWKKSHNDKNPYSKSKDRKEKKLASWLSTQKKGKRGAGTYVFYHSNQKLVEKAGYPDVFDTRDDEKESNKKCLELIKWKKFHGRDPSTHAENQEERRLGLWLSSQRTGRGKNFRSNQGLVEKEGYPEIFNRKDDEEESNKKCVEYIKWRKEHNNNPSQHSKESKERQLGCWIVRQRMFKQGKKKRTGVFYLSNQKMVENAGYSTAFNPLNSEKESNEICSRYIVWRKTHNNNNPSKSEESFLFTWMHGQKVAKSGKGTRQFYRSNQILVEKAGYPDAFAFIDREKISNNNCNKCINFKKTHKGKDPSIQSKDREEKRLGVWLSLQKMAKQGKGHCIFYKSNQILAEKAEYPNLFD